jgi:hypothetical protein
MRPDELERRLRERLDALGPAPRAELLDVHWVSGLGVVPGHWAHREPAPHGEPGQGK